MGREGTNGVELPRPAKQRYDLITHWQKSVTICTMMCGALGLKNSPNTKIEDFAAIASQYSIFVFRAP